MGRTPRWSSRSLRAKAEYLVLAMAGPSEGGSIGIVSSTEAAEQIPLASSKESEWAMLEHNCNRSMLKVQAQSWTKSNRMQVDHLLLLWLYRQQEIVEKQR